MMLPVPPLLAAALQADREREIRCRRPQDVPLTGPRHPATPGDVGDVRHAQARPAAIIGLAGSR